MAAVDDALAEMQIAFARMRVRADLRDHFHAGAVAALTVTNAAGSPEDQADAIARAKNEYVDRLIPFAPLPQTTEPV